MRGPKPDFDAAFKAMASEGAEAMVVLEVPAVFVISKTVAEFANAHRMPTMLWGGQADAGGSDVLRYRVHLHLSARPGLCRQVFKGAKPADIAIEVVSKHQLVINLKAARELGLTVPAELLKRADRVIE